MKKIIALILALVMVLALVACGTTTETTETTEPTTETTEGIKTLYVLTPNPDHGWTGAVGVAAQEKVEEINAAGVVKAELLASASADEQIKQIEDIVANTDQRYAGTIDRHGYFGSQPVVMDIKTIGSPTRLDYTKVCLQTFLYSLCLDYDNPMLFALFLRKGRQGNPRLRSQAWNGNPRSHRSHRHGR